MTDVRIVGAYVSTFLSLGNLFFVAARTSRPFILIVLGSSVDLTLIIPCNGTITDPFGISVLLISFPKVPILHKLSYSSFRASLLRLES